MSVASGPEIANDGLVFAYDMSNTQKSWRGAPTTNLLPYSQDFSNWSVGGTIALEYGSLAPDSTLTATKITNSVSSNIVKSYAATIGIVYCFSIHVKKNVSSTITVESNTAASGLMTFNFDTLAISASGAYSSPTVTASNYGWYRVSVNITAASTANLNIYLYGNSYGTAGASYIWGTQLEVGTYSTPYILTGAAAASRTNTQAIVDLTGLNTVTATSLTYASGNAFSFNGTSDYIILPFSTTSGQAVTYCGWLYSTETTATYRNFVDSVTARPMIWWNNSGQIEFDAALYTTPAVYRNQWVYVALSKPSGSSAASYYVNGNLVGTGSAYTTPAVTPTFFNRAAGQTWKGNCPNVQVYNRALSATEVKQNFNATRGRFGI